MTRGARAAPSAASEDAATRASLNYALGNLGGRQKSWMTSIDPTFTAVNRTTHPPKQPARPKEPAPGNQAVVLESSRGQPLSNSASPQLANVLSHQPTGHLVPSPTDVFPSPSPSEDRILLDCNPPAPPTSVPDHGFQSVGSEDRFLEGVRQAAAAPKRPGVAGSPALANKRLRPSIAPQGRPIPPPLTLQNGNVAPQDIAQRMSEGQMQSVSPSMANQPYSPAPGRQSPWMSPYQQPPVPQRVPSQPDGGRRNGSNPQSLQNSPSLPPQPPLNHSTPMANSPTTPTDLMARCIHDFNQFTLQIDPHLPDWKRIRALELALKDQDWDYLVTHLFYCLLTLHKAALPEGVSNNPRAATTIQFLGEVLDANDRLTQAVKQFFVQFPMTPQQMLQHDPDQFRIAVKRFNNLMDRSPNYESLKKTCDNRNFPPFMHELFFDLGICSKHLQRIVFTASTRRLWSRWGFARQGVTTLVSQYETETSQYFSAMQAEFYHRLSNQRYNVQSERAWEAKRWTSGLNNLYMTYRRLHMDSMQPHIQAPVLPSQRLHMDSMQPHIQAPVLPSQHSLVRASQPQQPMIHMPQGYNYQHQPAQTLVYPDPRMPLHSAQAAIQQQQQQERGRGRPRGRPRLSANPPESRQHAQLVHETGPQQRQQGRGRGRPRGRPPLSANPHQPRQHAQLVYQTGTQPQPQPQRMPAPRPETRLMPFFPPAGYYQPQQHQPNPARFALHQAHLRNATLKSRTGEGLYQYVHSFLKEPQRLHDAGQKIEKWSFDLTPQQMERIPKNTGTVPGAPPVWVVDDNSLMLRLRCVKLDRAKDPVDEHTWATSDTSWIPYSYFTFNGQSLEQRRKLHYGKDLPIDLTSFVKEGENTLQIGIVRTAEDIRYKNYLLAVEILALKAHTGLLAQVKGSIHVPAETTKQRIREKLAPSADDDEIAVVDASINISLYDPFVKSKPCDIPARSKACMHFDCFDLVTFLATRKREGDASVADHWRCPICNGDARPQHLIVDGFVEEVYAELEARGELNTETITVERDGSWKPKPSVLDGVADPGGDDDAPVAASATPVPQAKHVPVEIIDLGDSDD